MIKIRNAAIYAAVILTAASSYFFYNSINNNGKVEFVDLSNLTKADIDVIVAAKEGMRTAEPTARTSK